MSCPTHDELLDCLLGRLPENRADVLLTHAEQCAVCRAVVDQLDATSDDFVQSLQNDSTPELTLPAEDSCERMMAAAEALLSESDSRVLPAGTSSPYGTLLPPQRIRDYALIEPLGMGGMGAVYRARHVRLQKEVAIKVIGAQRALQPQLSDRFSHEMTIVGQLDHPNLVRALDAGEDHGIQYLVMELVDGIDLQRLIADMGPIGIADACEIVRQTALALQHAHEKGLVHRDVKPSNIMIDRSGTVRLLDLGLALWHHSDSASGLTQVGTTVGSLDFIAPEQLVGSRKADSRSDLFSLGCTFYFLVTGNSLFRHRHRWRAEPQDRTTLLQQLPAAVPSDVAAWLQGMLEDDPDRRPSSAVEVAEQVKTHAMPSRLIVLLQQWDKPERRRTSAVDNFGRGMGEAAKNDGSSAVCTRSMQRIATREISQRRRKWIAVGTGLLTVLLTCLWLARNHRVTNSAAQVAFDPTLVRSVEFREIALFQRKRADTLDGLHGGIGETSAVASPMNNAQTVRLDDRELAVSFVGLSADGQRLLVTYRDGLMSIRDLPDQQRVSLIYEDGSEPLRVALAAQAPRAVVLFRSGLAVLLDLDSRETLMRYVMTEVASTVTDLALLASGETFLTAHQDGTVVVRVAETGQALSTWQASDDLIRTLSLSPDDAWLFVLSQSGVARKLDCATGEVVWRTPSMPRLSPIIGLVADSTGGCVTADSAGTLRHWKTDSDRMPPVLARQQAGRDISLAISDCYAMACGGLGAILLNLDKPNAGSVYQFGVTSTGGAIHAAQGVGVVAELDGSIRLWQLPGDTGSTLFDNSRSEIRPSREITRLLQSPPTWLVLDDWKHQPALESTYVETDDGQSVVASRWQWGNRSHWLEYRISPLLDGTDVSP